MGRALVPGRGDRARHARIACTVRAAHPLHPADAPALRGDLLFGLEARFGYHAIAVAALPYGIVHHGKPFAEALGAVLAGAVLGFMALRSRSIAGGVLLHVASATAMDMFALYQKGLWD